MPIPDGFQGLGTPSPPPGLVGTPMTVMSRPFGVGQPMPEALRVGDLLSLPVLGSEGASIQFGDWLVLARPVMNDIGGSASAWWSDVLAEVDLLYGEWLMASPLQRLRLKPTQRALDVAGQRIEMKAVDMLLQVLPEVIKKDVVATRSLTSTSILFRLYTLYQPGGGAERAGLLKSISDPKVPSNVQEIASSLRQWRRCVSRAEELQITLADASILMLAMSKFADALGKSGGVQVTYRIAGVRQELKVDYRPEHYTIKELAEYLQAEAEELSLATGPKPTSLATTMAGGGGPVVKAMNVGSGAGGQDGDRSAMKPACKFWKSEDGCRKGQDCSYGHDTADMKGRCFGCGATSHVKKECCVRRPGDGNGGFGKDAKKTAKLKSGRDPPVNEGVKGGGAVLVEKDPITKPEPATTSSTPASLGSTGGSDGLKPVGLSSVSPKDTTADLMEEATSLLKSLRTLKAVRVKQIMVTEEGDKNLFALLDGGATHCLRRARSDELGRLTPIQVELASGTAMLFRHPDHQTLLSMREVEPIIPLHMLIDRGYRLTWKPGHCSIDHPVHGRVECVLRAGCPVMRRREALQLIDQFEKDEKNYGLDEELKSCWKGHFPEMPERLLRYMRGQGQDPHQWALPWNRRQRRAHLRGNGVIIHLFAGKKASEWEKTTIEGCTVIAVDTQMGSQFNLHAPGVFAYLWWLVEQGVVRAIVGGPPCRTTSRLRNQAPPGPRPLRGRDDLRWCLDGLSSEEMELVDHDSALMMKQTALWVRAEECRKEDGCVTGYLMESPEDPANYLEDEQAKVCPSFFNFKELLQWVEMGSLNLIHLDQGRCGHERRKPTGLLTNLVDLKELDGLRGGGMTGIVQGDLPERMKASRAWATWAPGLIAAVREALRLHVKRGDSLRTAVAAEPKTAKLNMDQWKNHVLQGHQPFRKDCRACIECMGKDGAHRRLRGGEHGSVPSYCMSADIVGPFVTGDDLGLNRVGKYLLVSTVAVPDLRENPTDVEEKIEDGDEDGADELPDELMEVEEVPKASDEEVKALLLEELAVPVKHHNVTLVEILPSRQTDAIIEGLSKVHAKYRMMGLQTYRLHTDREKSFLTRKIGQWCESRSMTQSMTSGDDSASNGRVEAEIQQVKRQLRVTLQQSGVPMELWPCAARQVGEDRLGRQLSKLGVPTKPMVRFASMVGVKTKRWHREGQLTNPFKVMQLMGPSPLMTSGWIVRSGSQVQHARAVVVFDPLSEEAAHVELQVEDAPGRPSHRLHGKQPLDGEHAPLRDLFPLDGRLPLRLADEDYEPESLEPELPEPALMSLRAGGGEYGMVHQKVLSRLQAFETSSMAMVTCGGCGLQQVGREKECPMCQSELQGMGEHGVTAPTTWPLEPGGGEVLQERELQEHWHLKRFWSERLATVAIGEDSGREHGRQLEELEGTLQDWEESLEVQHNGMLQARLATLECAGMESSNLETAGVGMETSSSALASPAAVLQTYTVPLQTVKRNLEDWKEAMAAERKALLETTKAIQSVDEADLKKIPGYHLLEMAPAKIVATVKAPNGRKKVRVVICGNLLEKKESSGAGNGSGLDGRRGEPSPFAQYAGGVDGAALRTLLRKGAAEQWSFVISDVRTAFLLAPRLDQERLLVCKPPQLYVDCGLASPSERWLINGAMYGLQESPHDWSCFRDRCMARFAWKDELGSFQLRRTPEPNLWQIIQLGDKEEDEKAVGAMAVYVDDILITAPEAIAASALGRLRQEWTCSEPEWIGEGGWTKFCGMELKKEQGTLLLGQPSYVRDLLERHGASSEKLSPMPAVLDETPEESVDPKTLRAAQALLGELLWVSVRTRPDLCFGVAWMGRMVSKCPARVLAYGQHMLCYLKKFPDLSLRYGAWRGGFGMDEELAFQRGQLCLEIFCDASYGTIGGRGQTGVVTCYGGAPIHWQSKQQPFATLSTTECELVGYAEAFGLGEAAAAIINVLECNRLEDEGVRVLYGDSQSGLLLLHSPDGAHRTRHLRLRHFVLRERIKDGYWQARHLAGKKLMADLLTKPIVSRSQWDYFMEFLDMVEPGATEEAEQENSGLFGCDLCFGVHQAEKPPGESFKGFGSRCIGGLLS